MHDANSNSNTPASDIEIQEIPKPRRPRGFAAMDRNRVKEIASTGGKAAHAAGTAHQFSHDEAVSAGRKGGIADHIRRGRGPLKSNPVTVDKTPESKVA